MDYTHEAFQKEEAKSSTKELLGYLQNNLKISVETKMQ